MSFGDNPYAPNPNEPDSVPPPNLVTVPGPGLKPPPALPTVPTTYVQVADSGKVVALIYGLAKTSGVVIERWSPVLLQEGKQGTTPPDGTVYPPYWQPNHAYAVGDIIADPGHVATWHACIAPGTSGTSLPYMHSTDFTDGTVHWAWLGTGQGYVQRVAIGMCEGPINGAGKGWQDKARFDVWNATTAGLARVHDWLDLRLGTNPTTRPAWAGVNPDTYPNTAVLWWYFFSGQSNSLPNLALEIAGLKQYSPGSGKPDAIPADIAYDLVTDPRRGAGRPSSWLDSNSFDIASPTSWWTYCFASNTLVSWVIDSQSSVTSLIEKLLLVTQTDAYVTGGKLRFVPRCDQTIGSYVPSLAPLYDLDEDDYLKGTELGVSRVSSTDTFNSCPVEYIDRSMDYSRVVVDDPDMSDVELRGLKTNSPVGTGMVLSQDVAVRLSRVLAQRSLNVRRTFSAQVGWRYLLLEPTDVVTFSDSVENLSRVPVRLTSYEEEVSSDGSCVVTLGGEDYPAAAHYAATYQTQANDGFKPNLQNDFNSIVLGAGQIGGATLPSAGLTSPASDNLFPNGNSETDPPAGADLNAAEWAYRTNSGAYAGSWCRYLSAQGSGSPAELGVNVPCSPGDSFYIEAQCSSDGTHGAGVSVAYFDASGTWLGEPGASTRTAASYGLVSAIYAAPANAVRAYLYAYVPAGGAAYFDAIYARRVIDAPVRAPIDITPAVANLGVMALGVMTWNGSAISITGNGVGASVFYGSDGGMATSGGIQVGTNVGCSQFAGSTTPLSVAGYKLQFCYRNSGQTVTFRVIDSGGNCVAPNAPGAWTASYNLTGWGDWNPVAYKL